GFGIRLGRGGIVASGGGGLLCDLYLLLDFSKCAVGHPDAKASHNYQGNGRNDVNLIPCVIRRKFCDPYGFWLALLCYLGGGTLIAVGFVIHARHRLLGWSVMALGLGLTCLGGRIELEWPNCDRNNGDPCKGDQQVSHGAI